MVLLTLNGVSNEEGLWLINYIIIFAVSRTLATELKRPVKYYLTISDKYYLTRYQVRCLNPLQVFLSNFKIKTKTTNTAVFRFQAFPLDHELKAAPSFTIAV